MGDANEGSKARRALKALGPFAQRGGNVAMIFALLLPVLLITGLGAIELNQVLSDKKRTQDVADSAALMGAAQLGVTPVGADQRAQAFAQAQLGDVERYATVTVAAAIGQSAPAGPGQGGGPTMTVEIDTQRESFFGNLLPVGGFHTKAFSTAQGVSTIPLCVLAIAPALTDLIHVTGSSQLQAGQCLVHSNQLVTVDAGAAILASSTEAGSAALGSITPAAQLLAPPISPEPFASTVVDPPMTCASANPPGTTANGNSAQTLPAMMHGAVSLGGTSNTTLAPGTHYFCGNLSMSGNATLTGTNVTLVFDGSAQIQVNGHPTLSLEGAQSGALAGFVIIADRSVTNTFTLPSDDITKLTGTVYAPNAILAVSGSARAGSTTPWTVIVAKDVTVNQGVQLLINANYAASNVPVPSGVGNNRPNAAGAKLVQ